MKPIYEKSFLLLIGITAVFILSELLSTEQRIIAALLLTSSMFLFIFTDMLKGFLVLVVEVLMLGFYLVIGNWGFFHSHLDQLWSIVVQITFTAVLVCLWLSISLVKNNLLEIKELKRKVASLQRRDQESGLLLYEEFVERLKIIVTGMRRRQEQGYFIFVSINTRKKGWASESVVWSVSQQVILSVRERYDLVAKINGNLLIVALQNTDREGCDVVKTRIMDRLNEFLEETVRAKLLLVSETAMSSNWPDVITQLESYRNEESV